MALVTLDPQSLVLHLSPAERLFGVRSSDLRAPLSAVQSVAVEADALAAARGVRAPGLAVPGVAKIGTWRRGGRRTFVSARRGTAALRIELHEAALDELLVSTSHADAIAGAIAERAGLASTRSCRVTEIDIDDVLTSRSAGRCWCPPGRVHTLRRSSSPAPGRSTATPITGVPGSG